MGYRPDTRSPSWDLGRSGFFGRMLVPLLAVMVVRNSRRPHGGPRGTRHQRSRARFAALIGNRPPHMPRSSQVLVLDRQVFWGRAVIALEPS